MCSITITYIENICYLLTITGISNPRRAHPTARVDYRNRFVTTIHHLLEYAGSAFRDIVHEEYFLRFLSNFISTFMALRSIFGS